MPQSRNPARYHIRGEHGRGGLGKVSRAHDIELGRDVAIKELLSRSAMHEVRFMREALITARLEHPGIVPVHEAGRWPDGTPFYAMKLVAGRPLRDLLAERKTVDERIALLHHVIAVADAIAYAHGRNIIHRDLKPANVIVGDFGETVVIDWGLAKDLSGAEDSTSGASSVSVGRNDDLTSAGAILGTPAYMAPEQQRGASVDQRADVYAIGTMLWELCSFEKVPPSNAGQRRRLLRRSGIDADLISIIDKALDPELNRRYADAGQLATDLKAFKAGTRIASRQYSLWALLIHWTRRHRTLALSSCVAIAITLASSLLYIRNVTLEQARAIASEKRAAHAQASAESSLDALTLEHAELLLATDPSAAIDALTSYHGANHSRANQLKAEARGRGVAFLRATPHNEPIVWMRGLPDGSIVSLGTDNTIVRTSSTGISTVLTRNVTSRIAFAYSPSRHLLAYGCVPSDLCILDVLSGKHFIAAHSQQGLQVDAIDFSASGQQLATLWPFGRLRLFDMSTPAQPAEYFNKSIEDAQGVLFTGNDTVAIGTPAGLSTIDTGNRLRGIRIPDGTFWHADPSKGQLVFASTRGYASLVQIDGLKIIAHAILCHDDVSGIKFIPQRDLVAYACREGTIGAWDPQRGTITPLSHVDGHAQQIEVDPLGHYILSTGDNGVFIVVDLITKTTRFLHGHRARLVGIAAPTSEYPHLISADAQGTLRAWPVPTPFTKTADALHYRPWFATYNPRTDATFITTLSTQLDVLFSSAGRLQVGPHAIYATSIVLNSDSSHFLTCGAEDVVEVWASVPLTKIQSIQTGHGFVTHCAFNAGSNDFITSGRDGRLIRWTSFGPEHIASLDQAITDFVTLRSSGDIVFTTADGALFHADSHSRPLLLRAGGDRVARIFALPDTPMCLVAYTSGRIVLVETDSWRQREFHYITEGIRDMVVSRDGQVIAVVTNHHSLFIGSRQHDSWDDSLVSWHSIATYTQTVILTSDGIILGAGSDGAVWIYSVSRDADYYLPVGTVSINRLVSTSNESTVLAIDANGLVTSINLDRIRTELHQPTTTANKTSK